MAAKNYFPEYKATNNDTDHLNFLHSSQTTTTYKLKRLRNKKLCSDIRPDTLK